VLLSGGRESLACEDEEYFLLRWLLWWDLFVSVTQPHSVFWWRRGVSCLTRKESTFPSHLLSVERSIFLACGARLAWC